LEWPVLPHIRLLLRARFPYRFGGGRPIPKVHFLILLNEIKVPTTCFAIYLLKISSDIFSILRRSCRLVPGPFIPILRVAVALDLGTLYHFCIPGPSNVYSPPFVLSGFSVQCRLFLVFEARLPCVVPLLHCRSSSFRRRPIYSAVHNFPGSEFSWPCHTCAAGHLPLGDGQSPPGFTTCLDPSLRLLATPRGQIPVPTPFAQSSDRHYCAFFLGDPLMLPYGLHHS
jgi:hypothetical protein